MITIILVPLAGFIAVWLAIGRGPNWPAITTYWVLVTLKNIGDMLRLQNEQWRQEQADRTLHELVEARKELLKIKQRSGYQPTQEKPEWTGGTVESDGRISQ